jgi:hypothetical protein
MITGIDAIAALRRFTSKLSYRIRRTREQTAAPFALGSSAAPQTEPSPSANTPI